METIPELIEKLEGTRHAEITVQRMIRVLTNQYHTIVELQERLRDLENQVSQPLIKVNLKNGAKA